MDTKLLEYATERQAEYLRAWEQHGSVSAAAAALGINPRTVERGIARAREAAARAGYAPEHGMTHEAAPGFRVMGTSTLYDEDGQPRLQWVKTSQQARDRAEALREFAETLADDVRGRARPLAAPKHTTDELLAVYPMGDPHLGMYAWHEEAGADFDLEIAESNLVDATKRLVSCAPACDEALIINVGDFFHSDTLENTTRRSGHALDVDTRWPKVLRVGARAMRACVDAALKRHASVRVVNAIGNHDDQTSLALSLILDAFYSDEDRVTIDLSPARVHYHRFGSVLIGVTHGDTVKPPQLPLLMATDRKEDWGDTLHRYWYTGHIHQQKVFDVQGVLCESFRTLAASDAWSASMGYRPGRDMCCIVHHRDFGEVERHRVDVRMLSPADSRKVLVAA